MQPKHFNSEIEITLQGVFGIARTTVVDSGTQDLN